MKESKDKELTDQQKILRETSNGGTQRVKEAIEDKERLEEQRKLFEKHGLTMLENPILKGVPKKK
ncbi:hypothetical protein DAF96_18590 [Clostridioides difficile]|nr:hypothetical protein [Clostridioides difficile]